MCERSLQNTSAQPSSDVAHPSSPASIPLYPFATYATERGTGAFTARGVAPASQRARDSLPLGMRGVDKKRGHATPRTRMARSGLVGLRQRCSWRRRVFVAWPPTMGSRSAVLQLRAKSIVVVEPITRADCLTITRKCACLSVCVSACYRPSAPVLKVRGARVAMPRRWSDGAGWGTVRCTCNVLTTAVYVSNNGRWRSVAPTGSHGKSLCATQLR